MDRFLKGEHPLLVNASTAGATGRNLQKDEDCAIDIADENQNQNHDKGRHISRVPGALFQTNPSAYKPKLISIGPYFPIREPGTENSIKKDFQKDFFGNTEGLEQQCREKLASFVDKARSCYTENTQDISNDELVEMFLNDGSFILGFLYTMGSSRGNEFTKNEGKIAQTLSDMLLFENQIPFFVLFELHKLKQDKSDVVALLKELIELVKKCYMNQVHKLTPLNALISCKYNTENLPKHLLEVVHSLCIPTPTNITTSDEDCTGLVLQQINPATELEKCGVSFKKIGEVHSSLFDIDFNWRGIMKIRRFRIDDFTETFLRNMIAYEQNSDLALKYFTDFVLFMSRLIDTSEDENLLCASGIIVNFQATDMVQLFSELRVGVITSSISTLSTLYGVINKVSCYCEKPWNKWMRKLRQDFEISPWKPIFATVGVISISLGIVVSVKTLVK